MRFLRPLGVAVLVLCFSGCGSRLNQENFDKIHEGMSQREVRDILGEPVNASGASVLGLSGGEAVWKDEKTTITVHFLNDKVVSKQMSETAEKESLKKDRRRD